MNKVNNEISADSVRVVGLENIPYKDMSLSDAISLADETGSDVIQIDYSNGKAIVIIEKYDKFLYRQQKKEKEKAKKQRAKNKEIKEIRMLYTIESHDLATKAKNIDRLLDEGSKVKISLIYKGRAIRMINSGVDKMNELLGLLKSDYKIDNSISIDRDRVIAIISK